MSLEDYQQGDIEDLRQLFLSKDPRSLKEMIAADYHATYLIEKATRYEDDPTRWTIDFDGGWTTGIQMPDEREVKAGDTIWIYGKGIGYQRHGFAINGEVIEWQTPWERFAERIKMLAGFDRDKRERAEEEHAQVDEWLKELKGPYLERVERQIAKDPTFFIQGATYEVYPALMAQRVESWVREKHPDADPDWDEALVFVKEFEALPYKKQKPVLHGGKEDKFGVSGHQVDFALGLAAHVLSGDDI
jgi:hypothetical protein